MAQRDQHRRHHHQQPPPVPQSADPAYGRIPPSVYGYRADDEEAARQRQMPMPRSESDDREGRSQRYGHSVVMCRRQDQEPTGPSPTAAVMTQPMANQMQIPSSCASVAFGSTHERTLIPRRVISYAASPASATTADALLRSTSASPPLAATSSGGPHRSRSLLVPAEDQRQRSARFGNDQQNPGNPSVRVAPVLPPPAFMANDASELGRRAGALGHGSYATVELTVIAANRTPGGQTGQQLKPGAYAVKQLVGPQNVDRTRSGASGFCDGDALREVSVARTIGNELRHVVGAVRAFRCPDEDVVTFIMRLECGMTLSDTMVALNSQQAHLKKAACDAEVPANGFNPKIIDTDDRMKTVLFDTLIGLCEMHSSGISHSDFKCNNVMVTDWRADIVDLGLSSTPWLRSKRTSPRSYNQDYRPPEFCLGLADLSDPATRAAGDIWAFGCAILVSMFRRVPFFPSPGDNAASSIIRNNSDTAARIAMALGIRDAMSAISSGEAMRTAHTLERIKPPALMLTIPAHRTPDEPFDPDDSPVPRPLVMRLRECGASAELIDLLLNGMLRFNPEQRSSAAQLCRHPFFAGVRRAASSGNTGGSEDGSSLPAPFMFDINWALRTVMDACARCSRTVVQQQIRNQRAHPPAGYTLAKLRDAKLKTLAIARDLSEVAKAAHIPNYITILSRMRAEECCASLFYRWVARDDDVGVRREIWTLEQRYLACHVVANALCDVTEVDASAYANAAAPILRNANVHQIIAALLRDLDHELDSPTPCACASLIIYCSPTRAVFRRFMGAERGFFAFRRLVVMITLFACTVTRDPDAVDDTRMTPPAIDLACSSIAFALEELVASHPETAAAVSSPEFRSGLPAACLGDPSPACLRAIARVTLGRGDGGMTFGDEFWLVSSALDRYGLDISDADASYAILAPDCGFLDRALLPHVQ